MKLSTRSLSTAIAMTAGLLAVSGPASAETSPGPEIGQVTVECGTGGGLIRVELLNPSGAPASFMVGAQGTRTDYAESMVVNLPEQTVAEFSVPNDRFTIFVWNDAGVVVDQERVRVKCPPAWNATTA
jgi:hypothetical protein